MQANAELWSQWRRTQDQTVRNQLVETYLPLVRYVAGRMMIGLGSMFDRSDLESYGCLGLIEAVERFDPDRGVRFETFAVKWIRGQILEGIRAMQWAPNLRRRVRKVEQAAQQLFAELGREPTQEELADYLEMDAADLKQYFVDVGCLTVLSMEQTWQGEDSEGDPLSERLADPNAADPSESALESERCRILASAIAALSEQERQVISLFYYEGLTVKEIAEVLGVTPARISQVHSKAIARLRGKLSRTKMTLVS